MLDKTTIQEINKKFRENDESHLWPINNKFNVTERAIRRLRKAQREGLVFDDPLSYECALDEEISQIVNDSSQW